MAKDQVIDGAGIAAKIMSLLPEADQSRLLSSIKEQAPQVAATLALKIYDFNRIAKVQDSKLQNFLHDVPHRDIAISLKTAEEPVRTKIIRNVSGTKLEMVQDDYASLPAMRVTDVEAAQQRILKRLEELYPEEVYEQPERTPLKPRRA
jgi:flagellar motor switch protein FliG